MKKKRLQSLMRIINERDIQTQEQLTAALREEGYAVTQATVSRDIKELGLVKTPSASGGYKYAVNAVSNEDEVGHLTIFSKAVISVDSALHTVVIKTYAGMAQAAAASIDNMMSCEILGSVAGDDTVLLICANEESARQISLKLVKMFSRKEG